MFLQVKQVSILTKSGTSFPDVEEATKQLEEDVSFDRIIPNSDFIVSDEIELTSPNTLTRTRIWKGMSEFLEFKDEVKENYNDDITAFYKSSGWDLEIIISAHE